MSVARHLLYVSDVVPGPGYGGCIIVDRHLRHLAAEGWTLTVVSPFGQTAAPGPWREIRLPARRWLWPPFRPAQTMLAAFRARMWRRELARADVLRADAIVTVCWGSMSWLAAALATAWHTPLVAIVHDWWGEKGTNEDALIGRHACVVAKKVFAVSAEMQAVLTIECARDIDVLYPIPASRTLPFAVWRNQFSAPALAHVGSLHPYHEEFLATVATRLAALGGRLLLLCPRDNPIADALSRRCTNVVRQDAFPDNADAVRWTAAHASALVVMYRHGLDATGRPPTGFPSRLVEFAQLGLPVLLAAPAANPIRTWADRHNWTAQLDPDDGDTVDRLLAALTRPADWKRLAAETRAAAESDFDPLRLHAQFSTTLQRLVSV